MILIFITCDVLDTNDKTKDDKLYVYKIDMYGAIDWKLPVKNLDGLT